MFSIRNLQIQPEAPPVDFDLKQGEVLAIKGDVGLTDQVAAIIGGQVKPMSGRLTMDGDDPLSLGLKHRRKRCAYMPAECCRGARADVWSLVASVRQGRSDADLVAVDAALEWVGIAHLRHRAYHDLCPGEQLQTRFTMAVAQIWDPVDEGGRYLILNDPALHHDVWRREQILRLANSLVREAYGVLIAWPDYVRSTFVDRFIDLSGEQSQTMHGFAEVKAWWWLRRLKSTAI